MKMQELKFLNLTYTNYVEYLYKKGYHREELNIDETSEIIEKFDLAKGSTGIVLSIRCPSRYKIIVVGKNQLSDNVDTKDAHAIAVRFADPSDHEISAYTRIRIMKEKPSMSIYSVATMLYKDITATQYNKNLPSSSKKYENLYRFNDGIELNGSDKLDFEVINPDLTIDSRNIRLSLDIDLYESD